MTESLVSYIKQDRPFLGICLGLQLLFERSEEGDSGTVPLLIQFPFSMIESQDSSYNMIEQLQQIVLHIMLVNA